MNLLAFCLFSGEGGCTVDYLQGLKDLELQLARREVQKMSSIFMICTAKKEEVDSVSSNSPSV